MSNGFIYVVDAHFIDKIVKKKIIIMDVPVLQIPPPIKLTATI